VVNEANKYVSYFLLEVSAFVVQHDAGWNRRSEDSNCHCSWLYTVVVWCHQRGPLNWRLSDTPAFSLI